MIYFIVTLSDYRYYIYMIAYVKYDEMELPILYKQDKKGEIRYLEIVVEGDIFFVKTGMWKYRDRHTWKEHKRDGQRDEDHGSHKSAEEVALAHAQSLWEKKKRKDAMTESLEEAMMTEYKYPVIPVELSRLKDIIPYEGRYIVQAKLDGERCTISYRDGVHLFTRGRKEREYLDHIRGVFEKIYERIPGLKSFTFDGELLGPGTRNTGRSITSTKERHKDDDKMVFHCFDIITNPNDTLDERWQLVEKILAKVRAPCVKMVHVLGYMDEWDDKEMNRYMKIALDLGYEGIVCKHMEMTYPIVKDRSRWAIKVKPMQDEEAIIVGAHEGIDDHEGLIVFEVDNGSSIQFITPSWTHEERADAWNLYSENPASYVGQYLTIRYKDKNEYGNYVEAVGLTIRDLDV